MSKFYTEQPTQTLVNQPLLGQLSPGLLFFPGLIGALVFLLILSIFAYTRVYVITPNNEAFVRTGGVFIKEKKVILDGGCIVLPGFHELTRVPLREISIDVERTGKLAVRTQDYLRANMRVTFYVCITADKQDVQMAASRLSRQGRISAEDIKEALEKRADDAIRAAAKNKSLAEIDSDKIGFADAVLNLVQQDLKKVGITLNNIAISEIEEGDTYDSNNFFDTQGVRLRTETIQRSIQQKREVELATKVAIEQKELDAQKRSLQIVQETESAKLAQQLEIEGLRAKQEREIQETKDKEATKIERNKILQSQAVEEEKINQQLALQQSKIQADIELEERNKQLKVAQILQLQEAEIAEITRQKQVESSRLEAQIQVAEAERLSKIAQQEAAIAIAEKERDRFTSEATKAQAEASVVTAKEIEEAEREQRLSAIAAEQEAKKRRIAEQNVVEIDVFRRRRQAEIARQAAELEAESIRTLAQANRDKALAEAEGQRALIEAENAISDAKLNARLISELWPQLSAHLPEIVKALAPQAGVLGDARIYAFPGANGNNGIGDINKLLMSTSGLTLINSLLEDGKLGGLLHQVTQSLRSNAPLAETQLNSTLVQPPAPPPAIAHPNTTPDSAVAMQRKKPTPPPPPPLTEGNEKGNRPLQA